MVNCFSSIASRSRCMPELTRGTEIWRATLVGTPDVSCHIPVKRRAGGSSADLRSLRESHSADLWSWSSNVRADIKSGASKSSMNHLYTGSNMSKAALQFCFLNSAARSAAIRNSHNFAPWHFALARPASNKAVFSQWIPNAKTCLQSTDFCGAPFLVSVYDQL